MKSGSKARDSKVGDRRMTNFRAGKNNCPRGFTLIEMVVVISMILILLAIALPMYNQSIIQARETTLKQNLATINKVIDQYTLDKQKAPQSLDDLVSAGYLKFIPNDITGTKDTWQCDTEDSLKSIDQTQPGLTGCHSGSSQTGLDGTAYSTW
jgi:general secretion pathway protein G